MKLKTKANKVEVIGELGHTTEFKIKQSAKMIKILSSNLYKNKIGAVIRELSCNAQDAMIAAGKAAETFAVHLPSALNPTFYVQDYGIGLDDEEVRELYTTYGASTKENTNDMTGALGLGSKSPFAYTDSFTIEAIKDGTRRIYDAYISENGTPALSLLGEHETDECNGLKVQVNVATEDISKFATDAQEQLKYFDPIPKLYGNQVSLELAEAVREYECLTTYDSYSYSYNNKRKVLQGPVAYNLELDELSLPSEVKDFYTRREFTIRVDMGAVDIAASREELSYDKETVKYLEELLTDTYEGLKKFLSKGFESTKDLKKAWELFLEIKGIFNNGSNFTLNHKKLDLTFEGKMWDTSGYNVTMYEVALDRRSTNSLGKAREVSWSKEPYLKSNTDILYVVKDSNTHWRKKLEWYLIDKNIISNVRILTSKSDPTCAHYIKDKKLKKKHLLYISDINPPKSVTSTIKASYAPPTYKEWRGGNWQDCTTPIEELEGYFVRYYGADMVYPDGTHMVDSIGEASSFVSDKPIYKFNATTKEKPEDAKDLQCLIKAVDKEKKRLYYKYKKKYLRAMSHLTVASELHRFSRSLFRDHIQDSELFSFLKYHEVNWKKGLEAKVAKYLEGKYAREFRTKKSRRVRDNTMQRIQSLRDADPEYAIYFARADELSHGYGESLAEDIMNYIKLAKKGDI